MDNDGEDDNSDGEHSGDDSESDEGSLPEMSDAEDEETIKEKKKDITYRFGIHVMYTTWSVVFFA